MVSDEKLISLWKDPNFCGSFSGLNNFHAALAAAENIHIPKEKLFSILRQDPDILLETKKRLKKIPRRHMILHGVGILWQADLGQLYQFNDKQYFLLCIDVFSRQIFCEALEHKTAVEVKKAFKKIFERAMMKPEKLETDQGKEFTSNRAFFKKEKIFFKIKIGRNKASFAEYGIQLVKTRLFRLLRTLLTQDWPKYLQKITTALNATANSAIGGLRPVDVAQPTDAPKVDNLVGIPQDVSMSQQRTNQANYESKGPSNIQKGDYVYADFGPTAFEKGYDSPVSICCVI